ASPLSRPHPDHRHPPSFPTRRSSDLAAPRAQRKAAAELVLAQAALDHQDAVAGEQVRVVLQGLGEEGAFDPAAAVVELDEGLRRSEEHTSELQSRENLVCRLLLENKK